MLYWFDSEVKIANLWKEHFRCWNVIGFYSILFQALCCVNIIVEFNKYLFVRV